MLGSLLDPMSVNKAKRRSDYRSQAILYYFT